MATIKKKITSKEVCSNKIHNEALINNKKPNIIENKLSYFLIRNSLITDIENIIKINT